MLALWAIVWQARIHMRDASLKRQTVLSVKVTPAVAPAPAPAPKPDAPPATKYADVATKNLFAKDRNPNVIIDPPKIEEPKKMPPLPVVYGVLGLPSGTKAIMSEKAGGASRSVHAGDSIGEFKIAALDPQNVTFDWDGKQISKKIEDLIDRSSPGGAGAASATGAQAGSAPAPAPRPAVAAPVAPGPGRDIDLGPGQSARACVPGDPSPAGTVIGGFRKNVVQTPFGATCTWVMAQ